MDDILIETKKVPMQKKRSSVYVEYDDIINDVEVQFSYEKIILDFNIIDFTLTYNMIKVLKNKGDIENFDKFLKLLLKEIQDKVNTLKKTENTYSDLQTIKNYLFFFMIITINLKSKPNFIKSILKGHTKFFSKVTKLLNTLPYETKNFLLSVLNNIFLAEYQDLCFNSQFDKNLAKELEKLFNMRLYKFNKIYSGEQINFESKTYSIILENLLNFNLKYKTFFENNKSIITYEDKSAYKLSIAQSIIRVVFSKEKYQYIDQNDINNEYYEFTFLSKLIEKDMSETKELYGDQYKNLFRKEDICDDIIKYMLFIFGNNMVIECFANPVHEKIDSFADPSKELTKEDFEYVICDMMCKLNVTIPYVLKLLLKLIYIYSKKIFTIDENDYSPIFSTLIFNFILNPRVQSLYNINSYKSTYIKNLNRLIKNTCFNYQFNENDPLSEFNGLIKDYHNKVEQFVERSIISFDENDDFIKRSLRDLFTEKYVIYPSFLFHWDCQLISSALNGGINNIDTFSDIKTNNK